MYYDNIIDNGNLFIFVLNVFVSVVVILIVEYVLLYWFIFNNFGSLVIFLKFNLLNLYLLYVSVRII